MDLGVDGPRHKSWQPYRPAIYKTVASWSLVATLLLIHVSHGAIGERTGTASRTARLGLPADGSEWRPPEAKHWQAPSTQPGPADSPVTLVTSSLDRIAHSHRAAVVTIGGMIGTMDRATLGLGPSLTADVRQSKDGLAPGMMTDIFLFHNATRPVVAGRRWSPTLEKHFLFRRDLSKTEQDTSPSVGAGNGQPITHCPGSESMVGNCTTTRDLHPPTLMTHAGSGNGTEVTGRLNSTGFAGPAMDGPELATLQSPLEDNRTAYYYSVANLDNHNDVVCDDEYQMEYNENCLIDHNVTCVGDPDFCNLTYGEYRQLLMDYIYPSTGEWILIASHTVVFIMGLVGNALVCIAVYTNHTMRTVTNIFIVNLAVADFFVILFCLPPTVVWDVTETWFMGKAMCKVVIYFQTVSVTVSVLTLTFISIDRWYAICFPLRYKPRPERAWRSIALIWLIGFLSDLPEFLVLTTRRKKLRFDIKLFTQCVATWDNETEKTFYIVKFVLLYTLPLLFMTVAYFQIVRVLWRSDTIPGHRESRNQPCGTVHSTRTTLNCVGNTSTMGQLRARRKAAKMLVAVVIMFAGCYFPVHMLNVARYTVDIGQSDIVAVLSLFSHWLCYANSAVNPVIYNFMSGKFRREFKNVLEKCRCLKNSHAYGGRVGGYDDRSLCHTATRLNVSPSTRSNYHLASVRDARFKQHTQQTSFNGSRHLHGRNSINHPGSLQTQISPISMEERVAVAKNLDSETLQFTARTNSSAVPTSRATGYGNSSINHSSRGSKGATNSYRGTINGNQQQRQSFLHQHHQSGQVVFAKEPTEQEPTNASPTTTTMARAMLVNQSSSCKYNDT
ncbi:neuropeptide SIFamide receptor-like [Anopheles cruzii]|uniref:neuropeptide SIFamide receptor-like n=1 Tax=Anopheles cruzii TaxID=68878 RepID=UPI0022EC36FF|nr:neuropeptide SIFamide receptor-like [Anopheles cruzii]